MNGLYNKSIEDSVKTNTVYFNNYCNLACTYCYETLGAVKTVKTSRQELKQIADAIIEREPKDMQTFFILFGGEPTLDWDDVVFFMEYVYMKKTNVYFNMITNGIKFLDDDFMFEVFNNIFYDKGMLSVDISYDGVNGNVDRIYQGGKSSTEDVIQVLAKLHEMDFKFRIRYTIHKKNINTFVEDIEKIITFFDPLRIITSEVNEQFNKEDNQKLKYGYAMLRWKWQNNEILTPICDLFCDNCDGCGIRRMNLHYYVGDKEYEKLNGAQIEFNHFEKKEK